MSTGYENRFKRIFGNASVQQSLVTRSGILESRWFDPVKTVLVGIGLIMIYVFTLLFSYGFTESNFGVMIFSAFGYFMGFFFVYVGCILKWGYFFRKSNHNEHYQVGAIHDVRQAIALFMSMGFTISILIGSYIFVINGTNIPWYIYLIYGIAMVINGLFASGLLLRRSFKAILVVLNMGIIIAGTILWYTSFIHSFSILYGYIVTIVGFVLFALFTGLTPYLFTSIVTKHSNV
jgi:hypothetical protein